MSSPRYVPRTFLHGKHVFGRGPLPESAWKTENVDEIEVNAARIQHELVVDIRDVMSRTGITDADVTKRTGFSLLRWRRVLRGDVVLRLDDLAAIEALTGYRMTILLEPRNVNEVAARRQADQLARRQKAVIDRNSRARKPRH